MFAYSADRVRARSLRLFCLQQKVFGCRQDSDNRLAIRLRRAHACELRARNCAGTCITDSRA